MLLFLALAAGGYWYGGRGLYAGLVKLSAGGYAGQPRDLVIDALTVLIQLGVGIGLTVWLLRALREADEEPKRG